MRLGEMARVGMRGNGIDGGKRAAVAVVMVKSESTQVCVCVCEEGIPVSSAGASWKMWHSSPSTSRTESPFFSSRKSATTGHSTAHSKESTEYIRGVQRGKQ